MRIAPKFRVSGFGISRGREAGGVPNWPQSPPMLRITNFVPRLAPVYAGAFLRPSQKCGHPFRIHIILTACRAQTFGVGEQIILRAPHQGIIPDRRSQMTAQTPKSAHIFAYIIFTPIWGVPKCPFLRAIHVLANTSTTSKDTLRLGPLPPAGKAEILTEKKSFALRLKDWFSVPLNFSTIVMRSRIVHVLMSGSIQIELPHVVCNLVMPVLRAMAAMVAVTTAMAIRSEREDGLGDEACIRMALLSEDAGLYKRELGGDNQDRKLYCTERIVQVLMRDRASTKAHQNT
ncbi:hypothetical protein K488DRAFT_72235 [Vararia minispora EC-137]|uniref:Uncharacterized protein n=1 Tax=Vararia minispora EC-137 TaxID=1314806 RepID=A0ACB8QFA2_9AGAM|nr:hypothetical protein K488DRAFT_72235 [Vararia minispora EC-137]